MYQVVDLLTSALCSRRHAASGNTCSAPMNREKQETISCVPRPPHTHSEAMMMTLRPRSTRILLRERDGLSLVRRRRGRPDPAQKIKFSLCVTKSPPPPRRAAAFTFPSLQLSLSANSGEGCATHLPNLTVVSDTGDPVAVAVAVSRPHFPLYDMSSERLSGPFFPDAILDTVQKRERKEMRNEWPSKHSELVTKMHECRQRHGMGVTLTKALPRASPLFLAANFFP